MTIVDTSVWIDFFRDDPPARALAALLDADEVLLHPWVIGELALGSLGPRRSQALDGLGRLPVPALVADAEVLSMVDARNLAGRGIGWVDAHLLASSLASGASLWTHDRRLAGIAAEVGIVYASRTGS